MRCFLNSNTPALAVPSNAVTVDTRPEIPVATRVMPDPQRLDARGTRSLGRSWCRTPTPEIAERLRKMAGRRPVPEVRPPALPAEPLDLSNLGPALRHLRLTRELTQLEVAQRAAVTKAMVSGYETAGRLPSVRTLARLLGALDTDFQGLHEAIELVGKKRGGTDEEAVEPPPPLTPPADSP